MSGFFVDAIGEAESIEVFGRVDARIDAREFEATIDGTLLYRNGFNASHCAAQDHRLVFRRR